MFKMPGYEAPDFSAEELKNAPDARWEVVEKDGVAPEAYHSTSMYPEYFKLNGEWMLPARSRMDASVVWEMPRRTSLCSGRGEAGRPPMPETMTGCLSC